MSFFSKWFGNKNSPSPSNNNSVVKVSTAHTPMPTPNVAIVGYEQLYETLCAILKSFPDCKALACVDVSCNKLLAIATATHLPPEVMDLVAAATSDVYNAPNMLKVSEIFKRGQPQQTDDNQENFHEIIVNGSGAVYLLLRLPQHPKLVAVFSCRHDGNTLGLLLHQARNVLPQITQTFGQPFQAV